MDWPRDDSCRGKTEESQEGLITAAEDQSEVDGRQPQMNEDAHVKDNIAITVASLLSIVFMTLHMADDIVRGMAQGGLLILIIIIPILVVWLYGTLVLTGRRSGFILILLGSLLGLVVPVVHFKGAGGVAAGEIARSSGAFLFVWTQLALGVTAAFSIILSVRGLWSLRAGQQR
jgi:hypothetical protein